MPGGTADVPDGNAVVLDCMLFAPDGVAVVPGGTAYVPDGTAEQGIASACWAALDVVIILRFWVLGWRQRWNADRTLLQLAGSLWLMLLRNSRTRRSLRLLSLISPDVYTHGWARLWAQPVIYWIVPFRVIRSSFGPLVYVGESQSFDRRAVEHVTRMCAPHGVTIHPFYKLLWSDCNGHRGLKADVAS